MILLKIDFGLFGYLKKEKVWIGSRIIKDIEITKVP